jgi:Holliday junction resolvasome RuvABC endonuclease subunit
LSRPEDQKEALGERLEELLNDLIQTLSNFQTEQATLSATQVQLTQGIEKSEKQSKERLTQLETKLTEMIEKVLRQAEERQARMEKKIDRMLTMLSLPLD